MYSKNNISWNGDNDLIDGDIKNLFLCVFNW